MSRKLYIFGIGGTGSRVLKALTMLFASGVKVGMGFDIVIPVIIDPDTSNGDLNRTKDILRLYQEIRNQVEQPDDFFGQEIRTINEISVNAEGVNPDYFQFKLKDTDTNTFNQYIGFDSLSGEISGKDDKNFVRLLYSAQNLRSNLDVGFKGNPNMGSIILNQFTNSEDFKKFGQTFGDDDAIFIVNSIFGGTGAAGFPLLLKNFRGNKNIPRHAKIKEAPIGGITYLPYFSLSKNEEINAESFEEKAKIAIDYYNRTIISLNQINTLYFIGNRGNTNQEEYAVGGQEQRNKAHFLELAGALAILDFCKNINSVTGPTQIKEFGIEHNTQNISFTDLNIENAKSLSAPLTKFRLYTEYLDKGLSRSLNTSRWTKSNIKLTPGNKQSLLDKNYFNSAEYNTQIAPFNTYFQEWIKEMKDNKPAFSPFEEITAGNALELVKGQAPKGNKSFKALDIQNCTLTDNISIRNKEKKHTMLIKMFGRSTETVLSKRNLLIR
ncbi:MAG: hypothetical protein WAL29_13270 [Bacteroidales bacterium]